MTVAETAKAKIFQHGRSQAVRLPKEFRLPGSEVRVRRFGKGVLIEPLDIDIDHIRAIFAEIDSVTGGEFLPEGRPEQPEMPPPAADFDE